VPLALVLRLGCQTKQVSCPQPAAAKILSRATSETTPVTASGQPELYPPGAVETRCDTPRISSRALRPSVRPSATTSISLNHSWFFSPFLDAGWVLGRPGPGGLVGSRRRLLLLSRPPKSLRTHLRFSRRRSPPQRSSPSCRHRRRRSSAQMLRPWRAPFSRHRLPEILAFASDTRGDAP